MPMGRSARTGGKEDRLSLTDLQDDGKALENEKTAVPNAKAGVPKPPAVQAARLLMKTKNKTAFVFHRRLLVHLVCIVSKLYASTN